MAYTKEMVKDLREGYDPKAAEAVRDAQINELVKVFAEQGVTLSRRSVIGKLTTEGLYVPKAAVTKVAKAKVATRKELVATIVSALGLPADALASFERTVRADLIILRDALESTDEAEASD